jgi:hypothetical protein
MQNGDAPPASIGGKEDCILRLPDKVVRFIPYQVLPAKGWPLSTLTFAAALMRGTRV